MTSKKSIEEIYRSWAKKYKFIANIYTLIGYRMNAYRKKAIASLNLKNGDKVIDLACGTGLNLKYLQEAVSSKGKIIGVDISDAMLKEAKNLVKEKGWKNVTLLHLDVEKYKFPSKFDAIFSSYALSYLPDYDSFIKKIYKLLPVGGRFTELSFKMPKSKFVRYFLYRALKPFGTKNDYEKWGKVKVWKSVQKYFDKSEFKEIYFGTTYIVSGIKTKK